MADEARNEVRNEARKEVRKEYIEREALIENLNRFAPEHYNALLNQLIIKQPTADVVEVKRGEWKVFYSCGAWHYDCPFCDDGYATKYKQKNPENFCHNCGADMRGDKK